MKKKSNHLIGYIAIFLIPISGLAIDIYTPALPIIRHVLGTTATMAKYTVSFYILGYGLLQLVWGPLSDQYGRRKIILTGLYLFFLSTLPLPFVNNPFFFLFLRAIQGIGVAALNTGARAMIIDLFQGKEFKRYINISTIAWSVSPVFAPVIGAELIHWFNWKACFYALGIYSLIGMLLVHACVGETNTNLTRLRVSLLKGNIKRALNNRDYSSSLLILALSYSSLSIFYVMGPFIIQNVLHQSQRFYGHCAALIGMACLLGNITTNSIAHKRYGPSASTTIVFMCCCCLAAHILMYFTPILELYMSFLFCYVFAAAYLFPTMFSNCLSFYREIAGTISAITGAGYLFFGGVMSVLASMLNTRYLISIFIPYTILIVTTVFVYIFYVPNQSTIKQKLN